jgi:DNA-directed RNA polymerase subunit N (RpoN/RPB10)
MHVLCPDCGKNIGEIMFVYQILVMTHKLKHQEKIFAIASHKSIIQSDLIPNLNNVFVALGIDHICCKSHLMSAISIQELSEIYALR